MIKNTEETSGEGKRILGNSVHSDEDDLTQVTEYLRGTENSPVRIWVRVGGTGMYKGAAVLEGYWRNNYKDSVTNVLQ